MNQLTICARCLLVESVIDFLKTFGSAEVEEVRVVDEDVRFPLPKEVART